MLSTVAIISSKIPDMSDVIYGWCLLFVFLATLAPRRVPVLFSHQSRR